MACTVESLLDRNPESWMCYLGFSSERGYIERRFLLDAIGYTGQPVTVAKLASRAGVSRSWIYTQPELRDQIQQQQHSHSDSRSARQIVTRASDKSLHGRLTLAHERITQLRNENQQLRDSLAQAHGQLRAARTNP
jgi:hypothetical protein